LRTEWIEKRSHFGLDTGASVRHATMMNGQVNSPWPMIYAAGVLGALATLAGLLALWFL
jgi:hypothetical protein